jgi:excisionase family DNA binding protein
MTISPSDSLVASPSPEAFAEIVAELSELRERVEDLEHREPTPARKWLTLTEAADLLGCTADAVRMRVKRGRLDSRRQGRRIYVSAASVDGLE